MDLPSMDLPSMNTPAMRQPPDDNEERQLLLFEFQEATYAQDIDAMERIIQKQTLTTQELGSALSAVVVSGRLDIIKLLLDHGAPITVSAQTMASRSDVPNTLEILRTFLDYGWSVVGTATLHGTMTMNLMIQRKASDAVEVVRWFLDNGAPVNGIPSDPYAPIRVAAGGAKDPDVARLLLSRGATMKGTAALHGATFRPAKDEELALATMKLLLDAGAEIDEIGYEGADAGSYGAMGADKGTALHVAAAEGHLARARLLVARGADLAKRSEMGYTAKDWALLNWREDVRTYLETVMGEKGLENIVDCEVPEYWRTKPSGLVRRPFLR